MKGFGLSDRRTAGGVSLPPARPGAPADRVRRRVRLHRTHDGRRARCHHWVRRKLRAAWANQKAVEAETALTTLTRQLAKVNPDAAASLRERLAETLTVTRLGITGSLLKTVMSTNPLESMIEIVRNHARNVKRWQDGDMRLRWAAAGMLAASSHFAASRATGSSHSSPLHSNAPSERTTEKSLPSALDRMVNQETATKFHDDRVILGGGRCRPWRRAAYPVVACCWRRWR